MVDVGANSMNKRLRPGNWYAISAPSGGYYLAEVGCGGDFLFADEVFDQPQLPGSGVAHFLRLMVAYPSIRRAGWQHIGEAPPSEMAAQSSFYLQRPVGAPPLKYNLLTGETTPAGKHDKLLEDLASWDALFHILPILEYHFRRHETPFKSLVRAAL